MEDNILGENLFKGYTSNDCERLNGKNKGRKYNIKWREEQIFGRREPLGEDIELAHEGKT